MRFIFVHFMANKLTEIKKKIHIAFAISHSNSNLSKKKKCKGFLTQWISMFTINKTMSS